MHTDLSLDNQGMDLDFAALLEASFGEILKPGDFATGTVLSISNQGLLVDVGWKNDGLISAQDIERMGITVHDFAVNDEIEVVIVRLEDLNGNLILSASQARQNEDWKRAEQLQEADEAFKGEVTAANKGGLIIPFGNLRGFIPASHVVDLPRSLNEDDRLRYLENLVGKEISLKVIEVNRKRRRLVFSQRNAERENRNARKDILLGELKEGDVREGVVSGLCDFGAFVDLGGADGLIHISELAWHRVRHPSEVVNPGDKVKIYILHLDENGKRIGLSLKRLQDNPWTAVEERYHVGQLVEGTVSRVEAFGAFVNLDPGIEALLHVSQFFEGQTDPRRVVFESQKVLTRIISIESEKQRLGLSIKDVSEGELAEWKEAQAAAQEQAETEYSQ